MILTFLVFLSAWASDAPPADAVSQWCTKLSKELRSVNLERCLKRTWKSEGRTKGENEIFSTTWGSEDPKAQKVLVIGGIHGDEITAVSTSFRWLDFLDITKKDSFLRSKRFIFIPLLNPDGFFAKPHTRTNSNGVDLNRNFSTQGWEDKALKYWKEKSNSDKRRYPGPKAASEIETQVAEKSVMDFKPDLIVSVHAPYKLLDHDGPIIFPNTKSPLPVRTLGAYPGSLGSYGGIERNIPVVTPELPNPTVLPDIKSVEQLFLFIMKAKY